jgi:long-chain acyl-CoA synthetase
MEGEVDRVWFKSYDSGVPKSLSYPAECLPLLLKKNAEEFSRNTATEFFGAKLSYQDLWSQIQSFAAALAQQGVKRGTKVAIMLPNCPQTIIAYYAVLWLGGIVVLTNPMYVEREMEHQWNNAEAEILIVLDHLYPKVEKVLPQTDVKKVIVTSLREYFPFLLKLLYPIKAKKEKLFTAVPYSDKVLNFYQLIRKTPPNPPPCAVQSLDDLALLQYTGGTTGVSKGVMLTHKNILANAVQVAGWFTELRRGEERLIAILPFFHVFGMTVCMNMALYAGAAIILLPRFEINDFLKTLHKTKPTLFPGVPTIFVAIVNHPDIKSYDVSSIRFCVTGSAPMPVEVLKKFESLTGSVIVEGFGLTESSPVTNVNPIRGTRKAGSIGVPVPDTDCRIVDLATGTQDMPPGEEGELIVRGPQVMSGYWRMPKETDATLRDGWLYTGDIAKMDEDGYVYIVDRKKDMIIAGGFNIYPREIDEVLYEHPKIMDAVSVGVPDTYRGETLKAFVVVKPGESLTEEEVIKYCKSKLAAYKVPKSVEFRETLPKTMVGKILRKELRAEEMKKLKTSTGS